MIEGADKNTVLARKNGRLQARTVQDDSDGYRLQYSEDAQYDP